MRTGRKAGEGRTLSEAVARFVTQKVEEIKEKLMVSVEAELQNAINSLFKEWNAIKKDFKGDRGEKGEKGKDGKDGLGLKGERGPKGDLGRNGLDGKNGKDGVDGKEGSPDTPVQIKEKLSSLKGEDRLDKSAIKGLDEVLGSVNRALREKTIVPSGGGLGNIQHESKSVSSGTTSISTNYPIGGGGYAIWAYYQGQFIVRGTHYTVAGNRKTLTLTFTPLDNETIDLVYIRG